MGASLIAAGSSLGVATSDNTTEYAGMAGSQLATETSTFAWRLRGTSGGTFDYLKTYAPANSTLVNSVITVRKNGTGQSLTVTYTSGQTGEKSDTSNSFSASAGDDIDVSIAVSNDVSGTKVLGLTSITMRFTPSTAGDTLTRIGVGSSRNFSTASTTYYFLSGSVPANTTERALRSLSTFTLNNMHVHVSANARTTDTVFRSRKNAANGAMSVTYTSGQTGVKEDTSNSDSIASGDDWCLSMATGTGTGTLTLLECTVVCYSSAGEFELVTSTLGGVGISPGTTNYYQVGSMNGNSTEAYGQWRGFACDYKNLRTRVATNSASGSTTMALRVEGVTSALSITYTTGQTGLKTDTDTVSVADDDLIGFYVSCAAGTGAVTANWMAVTGYIAPTGLTIDQADTITITDSLSKTISMSKSDTAIITDALAKGVSMTQADVASMADALSKGLGIRPADGMSLADALVKAIGVSPADTLSVTDSLSKSMGKPLADTATMTDELAKGVGTVQADEMSLTDALVKGLGVRPSDTISITDELAKAIGVLRADVVEAADAVAKSLARPLSDAITLTDALSKGIGVVQADSATISDSIAKAIGITKSETVTLADLLTYVLTLPASSQATLSCVIENIYSVICRDEETAAGGLDPRDTTLHAAGFYRHTRSKLEHLTGSAIDRKVQVYLNTTEIFKNQLARTGVQRRVPLVVRVGYFMGDHMPGSMSAMSVDDYDIQRALSRSDNWTCSNVVITPVSSAPARIDSTRYIWEIQVEVQL